MLLNFKKIKEQWRKLLHQEATPHQIASGFALGFFVSFLPIPPLQTLTALLIAYLLRMNKVSCLVGLHVHLIVFPLIPLVFITEYNLGKALLHIARAPKIYATQFNIMHLIKMGWPILRAAFVGAFIIGLPLSMISYFFVRQAAIRWQSARIDDSKS